MLRTKATFLAIASALFLAGCATLGSMEKAIDTLGLKVTPETLTLKGNEVEVTITGNFPAKYFGKKISLEATPVLVWDGGEAAFDTEGFQGEDVAGNYTVVSFENGKSFTYTASIPYDAAMEDASRLELRITGKKGDTSVDFEPYFLCNGVITTQNLVQNDDKFMIAKDNFQRIMSYTQNDEINYGYNSSVVKNSELRTDEWKEMKGLFALAASADSVNLTGVSISAYASPEGEISLNENLAADRAESAHKTLQRELKRKKINTEEDFANLMAKGEDWDGFKKLMQASSIADKDLILRVLEMYSDKNKREEEIRNIAKTYKEIENEILPSLRRSKIEMNYTVEGYTDEELMALAMSAPEILTVEELLFSATLFDDVNDKYTIYNSCATVYANDYRGHNNAGVCLMEMGRNNQAKEAFNAANSLNSSNNSVLNNLGAIARQEGNIDEAASLLGKAGSSTETNYNKGLVAIAQGNYGLAISNMSEANTTNLALAKLLNGDANGAKTTLSNLEAGSAISSYVLAICCARLGDTQGAKNNLDKALTQDSSLDAKSKTDLEFADIE
jgi:Flp pilus assembly protein TadD